MKRFVSVNPGRRLLGGIKAAVCLALAAAVIWGVSSLGANVQKKQTAAVKSAVEKAIVHCYALEGTYPPDLGYLVKNYGLILDKKHYVYDYKVFASNLPPQLHILKKN